MKGLFEIHGRHLYFPVFLNTLKLNDFGPLKKVLNAAFETENVIETDAVDGQVLSESPLRVEFSTNTAKRQVDGVTEPDLLSRSSLLFNWTPKYDQQSFLRKS